MPTNTQAPKRLARRWLATDIARDLYGPNACGCDHPHIIDACYAGEHDDDERLDKHLAQAVRWCRAMGHGTTVHVTEMKNG